MKLNLITCNFGYKLYIMLKQFILCFLCLPLFLFANEKEIKLKTQKVTVFLSGAQVSAVANVGLVEGNNTLVFSDLSPNIRQNSIQVKGLNQVSVNSIQFDVTYLKEQKISAELAQLKQKIESLKDKMATKQSAIDALETEESLLMQNKKIASTEANSSLVKLKEYANYYRERSEAIYNQLYTIKKERDEIQQELNKIQREINNLESKNRTSRGEIKLLLNSEIKQNTSIEISYLVEDAGWFPAYEIKAKNINSPVNILYQAKIFQNTGDDWKDVDVTLSTADPSSNNVKPNLTPYYLNFPVRKIYDSNNVDDLEETVIESSESNVTNKLRGMVAGVSVSLASQKVQKSEALTVMNFKLTKKYSIKSGDEALKVKLDQQDLEADFEYYAAPVLDPKVYLTATLKDWQSLDLLPGEASIYFEDTFTGTIFIDANMNIEDFVIALGNDQNIVVEREQVNKMKSKSFFRNNQIEEKEYEISIKNNKSVAVEVKLEDRIPISQNSDIKVSDEAYEGANRDDETGIITWSINLDAKAKQTNKFAYKVTYPKGKRVNLER